MPVSAVLQPVPAAEVTVGARVVPRLSVEVEVVQRIEVSASVGVHRDAVTRIGHQPVLLLAEAQGVLVGASRRGVLPGAYRPTTLVKRLSARVPKTTGNIRGLHIFTFNELRRTEVWRQRLLSSLTDKDGQS